jgi:hypothetical protein
VADRLMTATLEYEETGWYDGQYFVKPPEILARDRLLAAYEVRPAVTRLRTTLGATGAALAAIALALVVTLAGGGDVADAYGGSMTRVHLSIVPSCNQSRGFTMTEPRHRPKG